MRRTRRGARVGAAAYAIKAARAAAQEEENLRAGELECQWQRDRLPEAIRQLVLDDQRLRNDVCWAVFDCCARVTESLAPTWAGP